MGLLIEGQFFPSAQAGKAARLGIVTSPFPSMQLRGWDKKAESHKVGLELILRPGQRQDIEALRVR